MNKKFQTLKLPALAVLGASVVLGVSGIASAAPNREVKEARKEVRETRKEVREERKDLRKADNAHERRDARHDLRDAQRDHRDAKQDLRREQRQNHGRYDNRNHRNNNNYRWNNRPGYNGGYHPGNRYNTVTGVVTSVKSNQRFAIRVGGQTFNVISNNNLSRTLDRGDVVRVYGERSGNDIRNANVNFVNNR